MGRYLRPDLPGCAFHITARMQYREQLLEPPGLRDRVVHLLDRRAACSDVRLLAYVVMTNHLHLVLIQGEAPLGRFMQPLLRSVALSVHEWHGTEGHVFERRFRDRVCRDADHVRNAIAYTHANPVRAGLCAAPEEYPWSSHHLYSRASPTASGLNAVDVARGLDAFAAGVTDRPAARAAYVGFLSEVLRGDAAPETEMGTEALGAPDSGRGSAQDRGDRQGRPERPPIEAIANGILREAGVSPALPQIRGRWGTRSRHPLRSRIIFEASRAGYTGQEIARFLEISTSAVSRTLVEASAPRSPRL